MWIGLSGTINGMQNMLSKILVRVASFVCHLLFRISSFTCLTSARNVSFCFPMLSHMVPYGPTWFCMILYAPVCSRMVLFGPLRSYMVLYYLVLSHMVMFGHIDSKRNFKWSFKSLRTHNSFRYLCICSTHATSAQILCLLLSWVFFLFWKEN